MRKRFTHLTTTITITLLSCFWAEQAGASAPPRIVRAATSRNGQYLVISTFELGPSVNGGRAILGDTFEVSRQEPSSAGRYEFSASNPYYYSDFGWQVVLHSEPGFYAPWPIVSEDGVTLILINTAPAMRGQTLLAIYRKQAKDGILIRSYKTEDLWPVKPEHSKLEVWNEATPMWFAGGNFTFSADESTLLYTDKTHGRLRFGLMDGALPRTDR